MADLTRKQREALNELLSYGRSGWCTAYDLASSLFGERYGITAGRARGRLMILKRLGLAENNSVGGWRITEAGCKALEGAT